MGERLTSSPSQRNNRESSQTNESPLVQQERLLQQLAMLQTQITELAEREHQTASQPSTLELTPEASISDSGIEAPSTSEGLKMQGLPPHLRRQLIENHERLKILLKNQESLRRLLMLALTSDPALAARMSEMSAHSPGIGGLVPPTMPPRREAEKTPDPDSPVPPAGSTAPSEEKEPKTPRPEDQRPTVPQVKAVYKMVSAHEINMKAIMADSLAKKGDIRYSRDLDLWAKQRTDNQILVRSAGRYMMSLASGMTVGSVLAAVTAGGAMLSSASAILPLVGFFGGYRAMRSLTRAGQRRDEAIRALHQMDKEASVRIEEDGSYTIEEAKKKLSSIKDWNRTREWIGHVFAIPVGVGTVGVVSGLAHAASGSLHSVSGISAAANKGAMEIVPEAAKQFVPLSEKAIAAIKSLYALLPR